MYIRQFMNVRWIGEFLGFANICSQEAAENFVTETFHKADMARKHAKRNTLHMEDVRFSRFMTPESLWVLSEKIWDQDTFFAQQAKDGEGKVKGGGRSLFKKAAATSRAEPGGKKKKARAAPTTASEGGKGTQQQDETPGVEGEQEEEGEVADGAASGEEVDNEDGEDGQ